MGLKDGIPSLEFNSATLSGSQIFMTNISGGTLAVSASEIGNAELGANAASGLKVSSEYGTMTGSPAVPGNCLQFGTRTLGTDSGLWLIYGTAFKAAPVVTVTNTKTLTALQISGTVNAGSCFVIGTTASDTFSWIACGSGRV